MFLQWIAVVSKASHFSGISLSKTLKVDKLNKSAKEQLSIRGKYGRFHLLNELFLSSKEYWDAQNFNQYFYQLVNLKWLIMQF